MNIEDAQDNEKINTRFNSQSIVINWPNNKDMSKVKYLRACCHPCILLRHFSIISQSRLGPMIKVMYLISALSISRGIILHKFATKFGIEIRLPLHVLLNDRPSIITDHVHSIADINFKANKRSAGRCCASSIPRYD